MPFRFAPLALLVLSACATPRTGARPPLADDRSSLLLVSDEREFHATRPEDWAEFPDLGVRLIEHASRWVGLSSLHRVNPRVSDDCSGLVKLALSKEGIGLENVSPLAGESLARAIHRRAVEVGGVREGPPRKGDLVFFRDTYDRNRDGRLDNDGLTHVGLVEEIDAEGTVTFIHRGHQGVRRARMNALQPARHRDAHGEVINDYLRRGNRRKSGALSGALFEGYARPGVEW